MINTALTELLDIEHPVLCAPMAGVAGGALAKAVSAAGGFGLIGGGYGDPGWLESETRAIDCADIGIGFITWRLAENPALLEVALGLQPKAILLSFGDMQAFGPRITASGCRFIAQVQTLEDARAAIAAGAEIIVAQGTEAGGHGGTRATFPLVPAVVDIAGSRPVVAAGGIADGRGLAAALMLGAAGVMMGTRFYCTTESLAPAAAKSRATSTGGDDTVRSSVFDVLREYDWPAAYALRTIANRMTARFASQLDELKRDKPAQVAAFEHALATGDYEIAAVIAGESLDLVNDIPDAAAVIGAIIEVAVACLRRPGHFTVDD